MSFFIDFIRWSLITRELRYLAVLIIMLSLTGCSASGKGCLAPAGSQTKSIYALKIGGHTGLIFKAAELDLGLFPELSDLPEMQFYKLGWGDFDYYQDPNPSAWLGLKALFWPTDAAIHLVGVKDSPERTFSGAEIIELPVTKESFHKISDHVSGFFNRNEGEAAKSTQAGFYEKSYFYPAKGTFYFLNTCNSWTAKALSAGGCSFTPLPITAGSLFNQIKQIKKESGY